MAYWDLEIEIVSENGDIEKTDKSLTEFQFKIDGSTKASKTNPIGNVPKENDWSPVNAPAFSLFPLTAKWSH